MKILITAPSLDPKTNVSGISTVAQTIIANNKTHNYFHYLLGRPDGSLSKIKWTLTSIKQLILFPVLLKKNKIDIVHQNLPFDPKGLLRESAINLWCNFFNTPVFLHVHGGVFLMNGTKNILYRFLAKQLFKHSKIVTVLSELEKQAVSCKYHYYNTLVLMNSINVATFTSLDRTSIRSTKPVLLFLGRIHESKGIEDIMTAFEKLKKKIEFRFILCGDGPLKTICIHRFTQLLGEDFEYRGIVSGDDKLKAIADADYFLLPSRYGEGLPIALLETMAAGLVPIVTDDASMKFLIHHGVNGIRVNKKDPSSIECEIEKIIGDKNLYKTLSINAIKSITDKYDISNYIDRLNKMYDSIKKKK